MKIQFFLSLFAGAVFLPLSLAAGLRASAGYSIPTDTSDAGGRKISSANYSIDSSVGAVGGISTAGAETSKSGYAGQLYDIAGLTLAAAPTNVFAGSNSQLSASARLDDNTLFLLSATQIVWSVVSGPIASIDTNGLATAGLVSSNTTATVRGDSFGASGNLQLTVLLVGSKSTPRIVTIAQSGPGTLVINGTNGTAGANYYILTSTNMASPFVNWTMLATNSFDTNGNFNASVAVNTNRPQAFFLLKVP